MSPPTLRSPAAGGDADLAAVGALLGEPARCQILLALADGRALPAGRLALAAGVSAATASSHLRKLTDAHFLAVEAHGRHRYYRLAGPQIGHLIETLQQLAPARPVRSLRQANQRVALRRARTCYDHLAGRLGVDLMASLIAGGRLTGGDGTFDPHRSGRDHLSAYGHDIDYQLTATGQRLVSDFGVAIPPGRRLIRYCVDWTEQRHHLAGGLGRGLRDRLVDLDWVRPAPSGRTVVITGTGRRGLHDVFGVEIDDLSPADHR